MPVVRQLTTRFAFETDKRGIKNFQDTVGGMRRTLVALAGAFATGFVGKGLVKAGASMELLAAQAQQFTDDILRLDDGTIRIIGALGEAFERVKRNIPGVETTREFLQAFINFKQDFPAGAISQFETLFTAAGLISKINNKPLIDVFDAIQGAVESGDFQAISNMIAGFGLSEAAMENFVRNLQEVDPTGVATVEQRLRGIVEVLKEAIPELGKVAKNIDETTAAGKWKNLMSNISGTIDFIGLRLTPAMKAALDVTNDMFESWSKGEGLVGGVIKFVRTSLIGLTSLIRDPEDVGKNLKLGFAEFADDVRVGLKTLGLDIPKISLPSITGAREAARGVVGEGIAGALGLLSPSPGAPIVGPSILTGPRATEFLQPEQLGRSLSAAAAITIAPTFNITGTNANEIGQQIVDKFTQLLEAAGISFPAIEGIPSPGG